jgi:hypothetical protein
VRKPERPESLDELIATARMQFDVLAAIGVLTQGQATLLFYYSGHGKLRGNELCLVSNESITASLGATSIRARLVLEYL